MKKKIIKEGLEVSDTIIESIMHLMRQGNWPKAAQLLSSYDIDDLAVVLNNIRIANENLLSYFFADLYADDSPRTQAVSILRDKINTITNI